jgi:hypothetical protein
MQQPPDRLTITSVWAANLGIVLLMASGLIAQYTFSRDLGHALIIGGISINEVRRRKRVSHKATSIGIVPSVVNAEAMDVWLPPKSSG